MNKKNGKQTKIKTKLKTPKKNLFLLTLNEVDKWDELLEYLLHFNSLNYLLASKEKAPTTEHEHIHCMAQFSSSISLDFDSLCGSHVDVCRGTPQQVKDYVSKDGEIIFETGSLRSTGRLSIKAVMEMKKEDRLSLPFVYYKNVKNLNEEDDNKFTAENFFKQLEVIYIWGISGIGKSQKAREIIKERTGEDTRFDCVKYENGFWLGVYGSTTALYDDFRDYQVRPSEFINFIDYGTHILNVKHGAIRNNYTLIIITSIQDPETLYSRSGYDIDEEQKAQWLRRITKIIHLE